MESGHRFASPAARVALAALTVVSATLASVPEVAVEIAVAREVVERDASGAERVKLEPVGAVRPGDVLVYTLRAENRGAAPALSARIEDPIPAGTLVILESVPTVGVAAEASLDGGSSWQAFPATVRVVGADGVARDVPAPASSYTHLRWSLAEPLAAGAARDLRFKVRVR